MDQDINLQNWWERAAILGSPQIHQQNCFPPPHPLYRPRLRLSCPATLGKKVTGLPMKLPRQHIIGLPVTPQMGFFHYKLLFSGAQCASGDSLVSPFSVIAVSCHLPTREWNLTWLVWACNKEAAFHWWELLSFSLRRHYKTNWWRVLWRHMGKKNMFWISSTSPPSHPQLPGLMWYTFYRYMRWLLISSIICESMSCV